MTGASSSDIRHSGVVGVTGEVIPPRDFTIETEAQYYDREKNTEIYIDPITCESHVRGRKWVNTLTYQNVCLDGVKEIAVKAAAVVSEKKISVLIDDAKEPACELTIAASDGYTDFNEYRAEIDISGNHDITLSFGENVCVSLIRTIK